MQKTFVLAAIVFVSQAIRAETFLCTSAHSVGIGFDAQWQVREYTEAEKFVIRESRPDDREIQFDKNSRKIVTPFVMYQLNDLRDFKTGCRPYGWQQLIICDQNITQTFFHLRALRFEQYTRFGFVLGDEKIDDLSLRGDISVTSGSCTKID
jgi:hypothetical protein